MTTQLKVSHSGRLQRWERVFPPAEPVPYRLRRRYFMLRPKYGPLTLTETMRYEAFLGIYAQIEDILFYIPNRKPDPDGRFGLKYWMDTNP